MLEILSSLVCSLWQKNQLHINTDFADFAVIGWILCVITQFCKDAKNHSNSYHRKQVNNVIKNGFMEYLKTIWLLIKTYLGLITLNLITRMIHLMGMNLYEKTKASHMVTVLCGIKIIHFLVPRFLALWHVELHKMFLVLVQQIILVIKFSVIQIVVIQICWKY